MTSEQYLSAVEAHLVDLPWRVRRSLADDLRVHIEEISAEDLVARLGSPGSYATELRSAAGLAPRRGPIAFVQARRPRNVAIAIVTLVVLAGLAAGIVWARAYQPVTMGNTGLSPIPSHQEAASETVTTFRSGKPFRIGQSITNNGRFGVRIVGVPWLTTHSAFHLHPYIVRVGLHGLMLPAVPFRPFTLKPGEEWMILLSGTYANCRSRISGTSLTIFSLVVRERFLLWTHNVEMPLFSPLVVQNLGEHCH